MTALRTIIVDDEPLARQGMRVMLSAIAGVEVAGEYPDGVSGAEGILAAKPDLVFLDIQMPEIDGFDMIEQIGPERMPAVIFVTAYDEHALRAFKVHAVDYLLKPVDPELLASAVARARTYLAGKHLHDGATRLANLLESMKRGGKYLTRIIIKSAGRISFVPVSEIHWIEAQGDYVRIHTDGKKHLVREKIGELETRLDPGQFARIHRSTMVRLDSIRELQPLFSGEYTVLMNSGEKLTLSRTFRDRLMDALRNSG